MCPIPHFHLSKTSIIESGQSASSVSALPRGAPLPSCTPGDWPTVVAAGWFVEQASRGNRRRIAPQSGSLGAAGEGAPVQGHRCLFFLRSCCLASSPSLPHPCRTGNRSRSSQANSAHQPFMTHPSRRVFYPAPIGYRNADPIDIRHLDSVFCGEERMLEYIDFGFLESFDPAKFQNQKPVPGRTQRVCLPPRVIGSCRRRYPTCRCSTTSSE